MLARMPMVKANLDFFGKCNISMESTLFQMYGLTWLMDLQSHLEDTDLLILLTAAICHDLDHPGYNNAYQVITSYRSIIANVLA